jgi:penicillin amidase
VIVTANNKPVPDTYPHFLGREWDAGYRAARISELLAAKKRISPDDVRKIQLDDQLGRTSAIVKAVADAQAATADGKLIRTRVASWDGSSEADSLAAAAGEVLGYRLIRDIFDDELGAGTEKDALARRFVGSQQARAVLIRLLDEDNAGRTPSRWWDDTSTPDLIETPVAILSKACDETGAALRGALGEPSQWTWGHLHRMVYREPTLGAIGLPPLDWIFDRGPVPIEGSLDAIDNTVWTPSVAYPDPYDPDVHPADLLGVFEAAVAPSYRGVYDTGDWDATRIVATTGQSEHPLDGHYADLIDPWVAGELLPLPFSDSAVEKATADTLMLEP